MAASDPDKRLISIRYFQRVRNVGDQITPLIVERLSGLPVRSAATMTEPHLLSVGSIYSGANAHSVVWGTGLMGPEFPVPEIPATQIFAVRGKKTLEALHVRGILHGDVTLGDPGILVASLFRDAPATVPGRLGLVPHYFDKGHPAVLKLIEDPRVVLLDVHQQPEQFLQAMRTCQYVASSSLHGLIFADALRIPNVWLDIHGKLAGGQFKFLDYYSTTLDPKRSALQLTKQCHVDQLAKIASVSASAGLVADLVAAFPLKKLAEIGAITPLAADFVGLSESRSRAVQVFVGSQAPAALGGVAFVPLGVAFNRDAESLRKILQHIGTYFCCWSEIPRFAVLFGAVPDAVTLTDAIARAMEVLYTTPSDDVLLVPLRAASRLKHGSLAPGGRRDLAELLAGDDPVLCCFRSPQTNVRAAKITVFNAVSSSRNNEFH